MVQQRPPAGRGRNERVPLGASSSSAANGRTFRDNDPAVQEALEEDVKRILCESAQAATDSVQLYSRATKAASTLVSTLNAVMEPLLSVIVPDAEKVQDAAAAVKAFLKMCENDLPLLSESVRKYAREVGRLKGDREVPGITPTTIRRALLASQMVHGLDVPEDLRATCEGVLSRLRTVHDLAVAGVDPWPENMAGLLLGNIEQLGGRAGLPEDVMKSVVDLRKKRDAIPEPRGYRGRSLKDEQKREKRYEQLPELAAALTPVVERIWLLARAGRTTLPRDTVNMLKTVEEGFAAMLNALFSLLEVLDPLLEMARAVSEALDKGMAAGQEAGEVVLPVARERAGWRGGRQGENAEEAAVEGGEREGRGGGGDRSQSNTAVVAEHSGRRTEMRGPDLSKESGTPNTSLNTADPRDPEKGPEGPVPPGPAEYVDVPKHLHPSRIRRTRPGTAALVLLVAAAAVFLAGAAMVIYGSIAEDESLGTLMGAVGVGYALGTLGLALLLVAAALTWLHRRVVRVRESEWDAWADLLRQRREEALEAARKRLLGGGRPVDDQAGPEAGAGAGGRGLREGGGGGGSGRVSLDVDGGEEVLVLEEGGGLGGVDRIPGAAKMVNGEEDIPDGDPTYWQAVPERRPKVERHENYDAEVLSLAMTLGVGAMTEPDLMWIPQEIAGMTLPKHWERVLDADGYVFYHNAKSGQTRWEPPPPLGELYAAELEKLRADPELRRRRAEQRAGEARKDDGAEAEPPAVVAEAQRAASSHKRSARDPSSSQGAPGQRRPHQFQPAAMRAAPVGSGKAPHGTSSDPMGVPHASSARGPMGPAHGQRMPQGGPPPQHGAMSPQRGPPPNGAYGPMSPQRGPPPNGAYGPMGPQRGPPPNGAYGPMSPQRGPPPNGAYGPPPGHPQGFPPGGPPPGWAHPSQGRRGPPMPGGPGNRVAPQG